MLPTTRGNTVVVTHVHPANASAAENGQQHNLVGVKRFIEGRPLALGTVQLVIGLMIFLFGIAMKRKADSKTDTIVLYSGFFVWGAGFYVTAGSLTVAAARRPSRCLVNCAMAFSIVAVVTAVGAITIYALDCAVVSLDCSSVMENNDDHFDHYHHYYHHNCENIKTSSSVNCQLYKDMMQGASAVLAVFSVLQVIVSAVVVGYACYATCSCSEETFAGSVVTEQTAAPNTNTEMQNMKGEASTMIPPRPPAYSTLTSSLEGFKES